MKDIDRRRISASGETDGRMPAEWEPHAATWIAWPHNMSDWPGKLGVIQWVYGEIVRKLAESEGVNVLVGSPLARKRAERVIAAAGASEEAVSYFDVPTDRSWIRDYGPLYVRTAAGTPRARVFGFNAWAKYPNWKQDARAGVLVARASGVELDDARHGDNALVLEGGAVDVNGDGALLATEECLLDQHIQVRNPGMSRSRIEALLARHLGARTVLWLPYGIAGDDTHGHVDDVARFVDRNTILLCRERDAGDVNYRRLEENRERACSFRLPDGGRPHVAELPMPQPLTFKGQRLPASYANFYIANRQVLVPTFNDENDRRALGILAELFPTRTVVGIHAVDLVWGLGTLHCLTQQQPAARAKVPAGGATGAPDSAPDKAIVTQSRRFTRR